ncbi:serine carboxypeptidase-like 51 isoform X1 [Glycine max]|uniref:serine carboxypeptidase-like 51 isoform X1 n=1 Tax=Glycine max TaxID=3847 RepID=UPI001B356779|nr:serine carboxypeptidase-like 51 isoform X1 [Glycine max]XP_040863379.1 serine carboxypeptidase-like 51 isoform X1 [Glycine max]
MEKKVPFFFSILLFIALLFHGGKVLALNCQDGSEEWGYVQVRPKAHMFWWLYKSPYRVEDPSKPWPIVLWLQGGPGASGVGIGNFEEIGPLDRSLKPRNSTWLRKADLLFVDNPVGTGYSFVEDKKLFVKTDDEAATDLTTLLIELFSGDEKLQKSPLFIVAESYGGKFAVTAGLSALKAIEDGKLKLRLGGVALGDSWISPEDFVVHNKLNSSVHQFLLNFSIFSIFNSILQFSWGPLLKDLSRLDDNGLQKSNSIAERIKQQIEDGKFVEATDSWGELENVIATSSNNVDFYNLLEDAGGDDIAAMELGSYEKLSMEKYSRYLTSMRSRSSSPGGDDDLDKLLNGVIKKKLKIIPENVTWGGQSGDVFNYLAGDFMRPRINEVDELLTKGVNVTVYNGQVDLICSTKGTEAWVHKLKWEGLKIFLAKDRTPLYCGSDKSTTKGFVKSYKNLYFYWILKAGHFVPTDQPCVALDMVGAITQSPAT